MWYPVTFFMCMSQVRNLILCGCLSYLILVYCFINENRSVCMVWIFSFVITSVSFRLPLQSTWNQPRLLAGFMVQNSQFSILCIVSCCWSFGLCLCFSLYFLLRVWTSFFGICCLLGTGYYYHILLFFYYYLLCRSIVFITRILYCF